ncbi:unnamed protein product [Calypogeia fissa]
MGDPTGLTGALLGYAVTKLMDEVILQTKNAINYRRYCDTLRQFLENIQPLVKAATASPPREYYTDSNGTVIAGPIAVQKWLEDLERLLNKASALVLQCNTSATNFNVFFRNKMARKILSITKEIEHVVITQAPLAALQIMEETVQAVYANNRLLVDIMAKLQISLNATAVGGTTQAILQIEGMQPAQAFMEIRSRTDILAASVYSTSGQNPSSSDQHGQEDEKSSYTLRPVPDKTFGMDEPLARLQELLLSEIRGMKWVGVYGKGGIGKTLLAEQAYNSEAVQDYFQNNTFWLTVGKSPSIEKLLTKLCRMLRINTDNIEPQEAKTKLFNALRSKKALLVLDDVWEDEGVPILEWFDVTAGWDSGSKILVTTRNLQVLERKHAQDTSTVRMERLSDEDSWELFCEFAFGGVLNVPAALDKLGRAVADECKGLPLALKVIAGAQTGQRAPQQWQRALTKLKEAEVLNIDVQKQLYDRLQLSYDSLELLEPDKGHRLQKCFIYFAGFPEDSDVDVEKLVSLWAGEKLLEASEDTEDDIDPAVDGNYLLGVLIGRSLIDIQKAKWSDSVNSWKLKCRVHDVLRDLARHLIQQRRAPMNCLFTAGEGLKKFPDKWLTPIRPRIPGFLGHQSQGLTSDVTHLSLNDNLLESLPTKLKAPQLEVLLLANNEKNSGRNLVISPGFLESFSSLKVLDLQRTTIDSLPESLKRLENLVYLDLSFTQLQRLPRGLRKLTKLENLNLQGCSNLEPWPFDVSRLKSLSALNTRGCGDIWKPQSGSQGSKNIALDSLNSLCSLTALRNLSISGDREQRLTTLPNLHRLQELQKLDISFCTSLRQLPSGFMSSTAFPALKELYMANCDGLQEFPDIEEGACPQLMVLELTGCAFQTLPSSVSLLPELVKLKLNLCRQLRNLDNCFQVRTTESSNPTCHLHHTVPFFRNLRELGLKGLSLESLPHDVAACPNLKTIDLRDTQVVIPENLRILQADGKLSILT